MLALTLPLEVFNKRGLSEEPSEDFFSVSLPPMSHQRAQLDPLSNISSGCFTLHSGAIEMVVFFNPHGPASAIYKPSYCRVSLSLSPPSQVKRAGVLLWVKLCLRKCYSCFDFFLSRSLELFNEISSCHLVYIFLGILDPSASSKRCCLCFHNTAVERRTRLSSSLNSVISTI